MPVPTHTVNTSWLSRITKFLLVACLFYCVGAAAGQPDFPPPPKSSVRSVGNDMVINGRTTAIRMFVSHEEIEDVLEFYRELWQEPVADGAPGFTQEDEAMLPWRLVTRIEDGHVMTVQVQLGRDGEGAWGYLADSLLPKGGEPVAGEPPPPSIGGSDVLSNITHNDPGQLGQTAVVKNDYSVSRNVDFYRDSYGGWRTDMDKMLIENKLHTLRFTRGKQNVVITISGSEDGAEIVINRVTKSLL